MVSSLEFLLSAIAATDHSVAAYERLPQIGIASSASVAPASTLVVLARFGGHRFTRQKNFFSLLSKG